MDHTSHEMDHGAGVGHAGHEEGHHGGMDHTGHEAMFRTRFWICLALTLPVLFWSEMIQDWLGYTAPRFTGSDLIVPVLSTVIFVIGGIPFLQMARHELAARQPGMMTLISLAILVAYLYSMATVLVEGFGEDFFWELVTLIDVMLLGHWIEMRSVRVATGDVDALAELLPETAEVVGPDGRVVERYLDEIQVGDIVVVKPGATFPADGRVVAGSTEVDESMVTGESRPVLKEVGSEVIGGTLNDGRSTVRVEVTAVGENTALAGIRRLVEEAKASKSSTQLLADRAAAFLFYAALAAAAVTAVVWTIVEGGPSQEMVARVVTVLVIACPHALGLAVPLVVSITTSIAARNGTLIRSREAIDTAKDIDVVVFDKTGTLTEGEIVITGVLALGEMTKREALILAAAVEGDSEHAISRAFHRDPEVQNADLPEVDDFEIMKGQGVRAKVGSREVLLGGPVLIRDLDVAIPDELEHFARDFGQRGQSVIYMLVDQEPVAAFAMADVIRPESRLAVQSLKEMGIEVAMLTGDSFEVARAVADELGIDRFFAQVLPAEKEQHIRTLQEGGRLVAMVGDGINDAPALARADIGIAIGSGTAVAAQSADLILVKSNPMDIVRIIRLSAAAHRKQIQNIWWAAGYNIVTIPLAAGILAPFGFVMPPAVGAILMSLSTVVVALNAQLLRTDDLVPPDDE